MAAVVSMVLFSDDSAEACYEDGVRIRLSPCGTEFVYEKSGREAPPLGRRRHRTEFVTSSSRDKVLQLLSFRNTFSSRPFLPSSTVPSEKTISVLSEISEVTWPSLDDDKSCVTCLKDGRVKISSLDGNANLYMSSLQKEFTVEFLCQLSCKMSETGPESHISEDGVNRDLKNGLVPESKKATTSQTEEYKSTASKHVNGSKYSSSAIHVREDSQSFLSKHAFLYTWLVQHFSVSSCPEAFLYPMSLALCVQNKSSWKEALKEFSTHNESLQEHIGPVSALSNTLPLSCHGTHLHRWNLCDLEKEGNFSCLLPLKVAVYSGITYRFFLDGANSIEIYPGDGSVFISDGHHLGKYFKYHFLKGETRQKEELTYAASDLPPNKPRALYSVRSVITQAVRLLEICCRAKLSLNPHSDICCWRTVSERYSLKSSEVVMSTLSVHIPDVSFHNILEDLQVHPSTAYGVELGGQFQVSTNSFGKRKANPYTKRRSSEIDTTDQWSDFESEEEEEEEDLILKDTIKRSRIVHGGTVPSAIWDINGCLTARDLPGVSILNGLLNENNISTEDIRVRTNLKLPSKFNPVCSRGMHLEVFKNIVERDIWDMDTKCGHDNLTRFERIALRDLQQSSDIVIRSADKGGGVVIQNTKVYLNEANRLLSDTDFYKRLSVDPTPVFSKRLSGLLQKAKSNGIISKEEYNCLLDVRPVLPTLLENTFIPGKGRFTVYSDGVVIANFVDGVILQMIWNFTHFIKPGQINGTAGAYTGLKNGSLGWCRLHFPNRTTELVQMECAGDYRSYIRSAMSWCIQLDNQAQSTTLQPIVNENLSVVAELQKIQRFQFLLENSCTPYSKGSNNLPGEPTFLQEKASEINIKAILEKTSKAIQDIDILLSSRK
ncbi:uncharacterized protein C5orf34 homolog [Pelodytes ibericus]